MSGNQLMLAGAPASVANYIEDVFSTYLYTGTGASLTITNGIDLSGKGGLVWRKSRVNTGLTFFDFIVEDTQRGVGTSASYLRTNTTNQEYSTGSTRGFISSVNSDGFTITGDTSGAYNYSGTTYASFTFRKQPKFFDIVTYTGNGSASRAINHNLGSVPGCIFVKCTSTVTNWPVYHRGLNNGVNPEQYAAYLNLTNDGTGGGRWANTAPTATQFYVNNDGTVNTNGETYVAYIFAHNAGGFGLTGSDNVISCGSFTTDGSGNSPVVNLGYEPQWLLVKQSGASGSWYIIDTMRAWNNAPAGSTSALTLYPNLTNGEAGAAYWNPTSTGFYLGSVGNANTAFIYIAIRRGPMKTPTTGTSVFTPVAYTGNGSTRSYSVGFPTDLSINMTRSFAGDAPTWNDRLRGTGNDLYSSSTQAESAAGSAGVQFDNNTNIIVPNYRIINGDTYIDWCMRRAPGFFDVVCYTGNGTSNRAITHNLGVTPELFIVKDRTSANLGMVYNASDGAGKFLRLFAGATGDYAATTNSSPWNNTSPTSTQFTVDGTGGYIYVNASGNNYVAYLFATVAGVSKVGSYTGTGTTLQVNCGFTGGSRFVLIKRTDSTGDWYVWDSARGIVAGNDPYLLLNSSAAEVTNTDYVDTYSAGFEISSTAPAAINANGGTYLFLAIA